MHPVYDLLWPMTQALMGLPDKPKYSEPCNRCGLCCLVESCTLSQLVFGKSAKVCPALNLEGGQSTCLLVADPAALIEGPNAARVGELAQIMLGAGLGCDATESAEENAMAEAMTDWPPAPDPTERARVVQLLLEIELSGGRG